MNIAKQCLIESLEIQIEVIDKKLEILKRVPSFRQTEIEIAPKKQEIALLRGEKGVLEKNLDRLKSDKPRGTVKS